MKSTPCKAFGHTEGRTPRWGGCRVCASMRAAIQTEMKYWYKQFLRGRSPGSCRPYGHQSGRDNWGRCLHPVCKENIRARNRILSRKPNGRIAAASKGVWAKCGHPRNAQNTTRGTRCLQCTSNYRKEFLATHKHEIRLYRSIRFNMRYWFNRLILEADSYASTGRHNAREKALTRVSARYWKRRQSGMTSYEACGVSPEQARMDARRYQRRRWNRKDVDSINFLLEAHPWLRKLA